MKSVFLLLVTLILLAGWVVAASALYVVRIPNDWIGFGVVPKNRLGFTDTYLDVRGWSAENVAQHPDLVRRLIATEKTHWLGGLSDPAKLADILENGVPATQPTSKPSLPVRYLGVK